MISHPSAQAFITEWIPFDTSTNKYFQEHELSKKSVLEQLYSYYPATKEIDTAAALTDILA